MTNEMINGKAALMSQKFCRIEIFGMPALFTSRAINQYCRDLISYCGMHSYELRTLPGGDRIGEVKDCVITGNCGTLITLRPIEGDTDRGISLASRDIIFPDDDDGITIKEYWAEAIDYVLDKYEDPDAE